MLVVPADDHVDPSRARDDHVHVEGRVGDGHHEVGALVAQLLRLGAGGVDGGAELDRAGARGDRRVLGGEAEEGDLDAGHLDGLVRLGMGREAGAVDDVGGENVERRVRHAGAEHRVTQVELVVARRHRIDAHAVQDVDDVRALVEARQQGGRDRVARMDEERVALGLLLLDHRRQAGEAAAALLRAHPVDVVGLHEADRDRLLGIGCRSGSEQGQAEKAGPERGGGAS